MDRAGCSPGSGVALPSGMSESLPPPTRPTNDDNPDGARRAAADDGSVLGPQSRTVGEDRLAHDVDPSSPPAADRQPPDEVDGPPAPPPD